jgi:putative membrane protein
MVMVQLLAFANFDTAALVALFWAVVFGLVGMILMLLGFKMFDWITPRIELERELAEKGNIAVAIVCAAVIIAMAIVIAAAIAG